VLVGNLSRIAMSTRFSPGFFSTSCIIFNQSCKVLACFLCWAIVKLTIISMTWNWRSRGKRRECNANKYG
jgi:hypothetical protein